MKTGHKTSFFYNDVIQTYKGQRKVVGDVWTDKNNKIQYANNYRLVGKLFFDQAQLLEGDFNITDTVIIATKGKIIAKANGDEILYKNGKTFLEDGGVDYSLGVIMSTIIMYFENLFEDKNYQFLEDRIMVTLKTGGLDIDKVINLIKNAPFALKMRIAKWKTT